jgi:hypothetical protein
VGLFGLVILKHTSSLTSITDEPEFVWTVSQSPLPPAPEDNLLHLEVQDQKTYKLAGPWLNNIVTYTDISNAWITPSGVLSLVASTIYEKFTGHEYLTGVKVVRGSSQPMLGQVKTSAKSMGSTLNQTNKLHEDESICSSESGHMGGERPESEISYQYGKQTQGIQTQERETEHLILVTHGIGQSISIRYLCAPYYSKLASY